MNIETNEFEKLRVTEKAAFSMYSVASIMMYSVVGSVLTYFYTNVMGISVALVGTIMAASRIFDGVSDLGMGVLIEKTHSKLGKARCWVIWMCIPYSLAIILLFCVPPNASTLVHTIFIFLTYNFSQTICYTAIIMATGTLSQMMTRDRDSRAALSIWRSMFMSVAQMAVAGYTIRWANMLGGDQAAYIKISSMYAVVALISLLIVFFGCKERVPRRDATAKETVPMRKQFKAMACNQYFWLMCLSTFGLYVFLTIHGTVLPYYCRYVLGNVNLVSSLSVAMYTSAIICLFLLTPMVKKFGKRNSCMIALSLSAIGSILLLALPKSMVTLAVLVIITMLWGCGKASINGTLYACVADAVEYGDWKFQVRSEGLMHSASSFGGKIGTGVGTLIVTGLMGMVGYNGKLTVQSPEVTKMIGNILVFGTLFVFVGLFIIYLFYKLDKIFPTVIKELTEREDRQKAMKVQ